MRAEIIANLMVDRLASSLVYANFLSHYNEELIDLAKGYQIDLPHGYNLVSLAISAAHQAGAHDMAEEVAIDAINNAVFKEKKDDELQYDLEYVKWRVLPHLVYGLKAKGESLEEIHKNHFVQDLMRDYNIKESQIERLFREGKKPAGKPIVKMMEKKKVTGNIFEKYTPSDGKFVTFWFKVIKNQCLDILAKIHRADRLMEEALRVHPTEGGGHFDGIHDSKQDEDPITKSEAKSLKKRLINYLKTKNPKYEAAINLISDGKDIFSIRDKHLFEKDLDMDNQEFSHFKIYFMKDLKHAFDHLEIHNTNEGLAVLKSAKIAKKILEKLFDNGL